MGLRSAFPKLKPFLLTNAPTRHPFPHPLYLEASICELYCFPLDHLEPLFLHLNFEKKADD